MTTLIPTKEEMMEDGHQRPSYYAILPANVRYDKNLSYFEKIMYGEITALSNKFGYCRGSNLFFARNFDCSEKTIERAINNLSSKGYVVTTIEKFSGGSARKIYITPRGSQYPPDKNVPTHPTKMSGGYPEKQSKNGVDAGDSEGESELNSTRSNNTSSIDIYKNIYTGSKNDDSTKESGDEAKPTKATIASSGVKLSLLPSFLGHSPLTKLLGLYELMFRFKFGVKPKKITINSRDGAVVNRLLKEYGEIESALCIVLHFDWRGLTGGDDVAYKKIENNGFPIAWIANNAPLYRAYIKNKLKIDDEVKAVEKINEVINKVQDNGNTK